MLLVAGGLAAGAAALWLRPRPAAPTASPQTNSSRAPAQAAARVSGHVELRTSSASALAPGAPAQVVVYAFALDGPRVALAVLRRPVTDLPFDFTLDDTLAPNPAFRLSQAAQLVVGARLGPGDAVQPQPGDWSAAPQAVPLGAQGVHLLLEPSPR